MADVRLEGSVRRQFSITNVDKFPAYTFQYLHQGYHYDQGYKADAPDTVTVENNKRYESASWGDTKTNLMALDAKGNWTKASVEIGGEASAGPQVSSIVDVYEISSIKNGIIKLKKIKEIYLYKDGTEKSKKASAGFISFIGNDRFTGGLAIVCSLALIGLIVLFIVRKRKQQYQPVIA
jgi:hypothetical protein